MIKYKTLSNGLKYIIIPKARSNITDLVLSFNVGAFNEPKNKYGLAHFLEHTVFNGTSSFSTEESLTDFITLKGGKFNGKTSYNTTSYDVSIINQNIPDGMNVLYELVQKPLLNKSSIAKERQIISRELAQRQSGPYFKVNKKIYKWEYGDSRLSQEIIGSKTSLKGISKKDIQSFYKKFYLAQNAILTVASSLPQKKLEVLIVKHFTEFSTGNATGYYYWPIVEGNKYILGYVEDEKQIYSRIHFSGSDFYNQSVDDTTIASLYNYILGGAHNSRLFKEIRSKKRIAYYVGSRLRFDKKSFDLHISCEYAKDGIDDFYNSVYEIMKSLAQSEVGAEELEAAKNLYRFNTFNLAENPTNLARFYSGRVFSDFAYDLDDINNAIKSVTTKDIKTFADKILKIKPHIVSYTSKKLLSQREFSTICRKFLSNFG